MLDLNKCPCLTCNLVKCPDNCDNKNCPVWRDWFIRKWEELRKTWPT